MQFAWHAALRIKSVRSVLLAAVRNAVLETFAPMLLRRLSFFHPQPLFCCYAERHQIQIAIAVSQRYSLEPSKPFSHDHARSDLTQRPVWVQTSLLDTGYSKPYMVQGLGCNFRCPGCTVRRMISPYRYDFKAPTLNFQTLN